MKKTSPFNTEKYCNRTQRIKHLSRPGSFWESKLLGTLAVILFVFIDFQCLKATWDLVQTEDSGYILCTAIACAMALDIPLAIGAIALKKCHHRLISKAEKNIILIPAIIVFALAFACNFGFRLTMRDSTFEIGSSSNLVNTASAIETDTPNNPEDTAASEADSPNGNNQPAILLAGIYSGLIPLLTSLSSFVISYFSCNPLRDELAKLEKEKIGLQSHITEAQKELSEIQSSEEFCAGLIARENDLYREFACQLDADALSAKQLVRLLLMKKLKTAEDITAMSNAAQKLMHDRKADENPENQLPTFVDSQINTTEDNEKVVSLFTGHVA